jgi:aryl-alcohol dehydrogenase-like predicted oxidoreductase
MIQTWLITGGIGIRIINLPGTTMHVSGICLGTAEFGASLSAGPAEALLDSFLEAGGNFIDTAAVYADWASEEKSSSEKIIGRWLKSRGVGNRMILATKGGHPLLDRMDESRMSPVEIVRDIEASLSHLGTETIDLYYLHRDDPARPVEEIINTLNGQIRRGVIRHIGCSNWSATRIREAQIYAAESGQEGFSANQMMWSLAAANAKADDSTLTGMDAEMKEFHSETGMAVIPYSSQAGGLFQKMSHGTPLEAMPKPYRLDINRLRSDRVMRLSEDIGVSITAVTMGYLMSQNFAVVPVVGCRTSEQLQDTMNGSELRLSQEQLLYLEGAGTLAKTLL